MTPKGCPNGCLYFLLASLGRPLGHHWCPKPFSNIRKTKMLPTCPLEVQITPKSDPADPKSQKTSFESASAFETWPGGLREAPSINGAFHVWVVAGHYCLSLFAASWISLRWKRRKETNNEQEATKQTHTQNTDEFLSERDRVGGWALVTKHMVTKQVGGTHRCCDKYLDGLW